jgi:diaminopimelate epimerase
MRLNFTKMQATGNDFVVVDNRDGTLDMATMIRLTPILCNRTLGVGADGTLFLCKSDQFDFEMVYRNADGSDAGMCGNGGRAISLFAATLGLGNHLKFEVHGVPYSSTINGNQVELSFDGFTCVPRVHNTAEGTIYEVFTGTEHIVIPVQESAHMDLDFIRSKGRELRYSQLFAPKGTNVNFCTFNSNNVTKLSTYERGVEDRTLACGTGSVATAIVDAHLNNPNDNVVEISSGIESQGGTLHVSFKRNPTTGTYFDIRLSGAAQIVFEGQLDV